MNRLSVLAVLIGFTALGQQTVTNVNVGTAPNDKTGDPARTAFIKLNTNDLFLQQQIIALSNTVATLPSSGNTNLGTSFNAGLASTNLSIFGMRQGTYTPLLPPMGFNGYNYGGVVQSVYMTAVDYFLANGFTQLGYIYFNLDGGWQATTRDANGNLQYDPVKWPTPQAWYQHCDTNQLKRGVWQEQGLTTGGLPAPVNSSGGPASIGHYEQDAEFFANNGFTWLKLDGASGPNPLAEPGFIDWVTRCKSNNVNAIVESACNGITRNSFEEVNMLRPPGLFADVSSWDIMWKWVDWYTAQSQIYGPGHWPYLDMQPNFINDNLAQKACDWHAWISMGALMSSPTILGNYGALGSMFFTNREVITCNQDFLVQCSKKIYSNNLSEVYVKESGVYPNSKYVGLVNRGPNPITATLAIDPSSLGGVFSVRDMWARSYVTYATNTWSTNIQSKDMVFIRADPGIIPPFPYGTNYLSDYYFMPVWTNAWAASGIAPPGYFVAPNTPNWCLPINRNKNSSGGSLNIGGTNYSKGFSFLGNAQMDYFVGGQATQCGFTAGIDFNTGSGGGYKIDVLADGVNIATTAALSFSTIWTTNFAIPSGAQKLSFVLTSTQALGVINNNNEQIVNLYVVCPYPKYGP